MMGAGQTSIVLRAARPDECAVLSALCLRSKAWWGYDDAFIEACREELSIREGDIGELQRVAQVDGVAAGMAQLDEHQGDWHLDKLFVDPPFIGKGVGGALMHWAIGKAKAIGISRLIVEADPDAADFYRRFGARDDGLVASGSIPDRFLPKLVMDIV